MTIDTTRSSFARLLLEGRKNLCSHLQRKLFDEDGIYHPIWIVLVLAGKSAPKIIREDPLCELAVC